MSTPEKPGRSYSIVGPDRYRPPDYARVVRSLSVEELRSELDAKRGDAGYRRAIRAEIKRREQG